MRPAAGKKIKSNELRTIEALVKTCEYLIKKYRFTYHPAKQFQKRLKTFGFYFIEKVSISVMSLLID